jgi:hypothetical protein
MSECVVLNRRRLLLLGVPWILTAWWVMFGQESSERTAKTLDTNTVLSATFDVASIRLNKSTSGYAFLGFTPDGFSARRSLLQSIQSPAGANALDSSALHDYAPRPAHLKWLLDSNPAIRWQVMMFKIMLEKHGMYSYAHTNQHTHGANRQCSKAG